MSYYNIEIDLHYIVLEDVDLIERYTVVKNNEEKDLAIENIASGQMHIPHENLTFRNTHGYWGAEQQMFSPKSKLWKNIF